MTDFTELTLVEETRWDIVCYKAYGNVTRIPAIAEANPTIPLNVLIPAGTKMYIPILEETDIITELLPPWKR